MIIAKEKKATNIAEYILYMWQIEDMIRAYNFDIEMVDKNIIQNFDQPDDIKQEMRIWYEDLIQKMINQDIKKTGHLNFLQELVEELDELHLKLIQNPDELNYIEAYNKAKPAIKDLKNKAKGTVSGDIEASLQGLYGILLLKLQRKPLNTSTQEALASISHLLALLNEKYQERKGKKNQAS
jgi:flagellin-specific chaperone FliS